MRFFELLIPIFLGLYLLWPRPRPFIVRLAPLLAAAATLLHLFFEGYRWQMVPLYILTLVMASGSLIKSTRTKGRQKFAAALTLILLGVSTALPILLPVPKIPAPGGPFSVGTTIFELTDSSRMEIYSGRSGEPRRFMVQVWYPAAVSSADSQAPWMADAAIFTPAVSGMIGMPFFFLDHLALAKTPAYQSAQIAESADPFPVIIFSHGWKGFSASNTSQAIELASRGYVVIALHHTYGAITTVFQDGTVVPNNPEALPADENDPDYEEVARKVADQWAGDIAYVLDQLEGSGGEVGQFFSQKLDMARIGVYGHSTGGGAAVQFCGTDARCRALLGMDPFMRPVSAEVIASGVPIPSFFMFSQQWADETGSVNNTFFSEFYAGSANGLGVIEILGTSHLDFSDLPLLSPIAPQLGLKGPLNGLRVTEIVNSYLVDFFEMTLMDKASNLFSGDFSKFPEVKQLK